VDISTTIAAFLTVFLIHASQVPHGRTTNPDEIIPTRESARNAFIGAGYTPTPIAR
jgi:hypothetical protein